MTLVMGWRAGPWLPLLTSKSVCQRGFREAVCAAAHDLRRTEV